MKETKRRVELFSFYDRTGLEAHLARMAGRGWLLEKIGAFLWTYHKIEPRQLAFSVCYFPRASQFDPEPSQEQQTFYEFCAHTGWTLAASSAQLQVFYNERPDPIPIDTDPAVEVEAIHRAMKRGVLPSQALLLGVAVLNGALFVTRLLGDPIGVLASAANLFTGLCWVLIIALLGVEWAGYFSWRRKAVRAAQRGEFCQTRSRRKLQIASLVLLTIGLALYPVRPLLRQPDDGHPDGFDVLRLHPGGVFAGVQHQGAAQTPESPRRGEPRRLHRRQPRPVPGHPDGHHLRHLLRLWPGLAVPGCGRGLAAPGGG